MAKKHHEPDTYWKERLPPDAFAVCRLKATEAPFSGEYYMEKRPGAYHCRCCDTPLFTHVTKYDSGSGWPSFYAPASETAITEKRDTSLRLPAGNPALSALIAEGSSPEQEWSVIIRTEILCTTCGSHLGHVFPDGPAPTGLRYCVNSLSLRFAPV